MGVCGIIHDREKRIRVVFDTALRGKERIAMHPGDTRETVILSCADLEKYVRSCGSEPLFYDF